MKTKIVVASLFVLVSLGMAFAGGGSQSVTDTSFVTLAAPRTSGQPAWTTNTVYSLGDIAKANSGYYLVVVAGTSGAAVARSALGDRPCCSIVDQRRLRALEAEVRL